MSKDELIEYSWERKTGMAELTYERNDGTTYTKVEKQDKWWSPVV
jgi:hypothetical protein